MRGAWIVLSVLALAAGGAVAQDAALPVVVGGGAGNACALGHAGGAIDVHVGPGEQYEVYDHLAGGEATFVCQSTRGWYGIVYGKSDCGVSKPIAQKQIYIGGCKTGWVSTKALAATSG
jgi:hypothetical protein